MTPLKICKYPSLYHIVFHDEEIRERTLRCLHNVFSLCNILYFLCYIFPLCSWMVQNIIAEWLQEWEMYLLCSCPVQNIITGWLKELEIMFEDVEIWTTVSNLEIFCSLGMKLKSWSDGLFKFMMICNLSECTFSQMPLVRKCHMDEDDTVNFNTPWLLTFTGEDWLLFYTCDAWCLWLYY